MKWIIDKPVVVAVCCVSTFVVSMIGLVIERRCTNQALLLIKPPLASLHGDRPSATAYATNRLTKSDKAGFLIECLKRDRANTRMTLRGYGNKDLFGTQ